MHSRSLPVHGALAGFAAGTTLVQFGSGLADARWLAAGAALFLVAAVLVHVQSERARALRVLSIVCAMALVGATLATWRATSRLAEQLPHTLEGTEIVVSGVVAAMPSRTATGTRFVLEVDEAETRATSFPRRLSLSWRAAAEDGGSSAAVRVHAGERWRLVVRLKRPHSTLNFAGFDAEAWLFERDLRAVGYVRDDARDVLLDTFVACPSTIIERAREHLRARIERVLAGAPYAGVIVALAIGDQQSVPQSQWHIFSRTGISHLVSISGLHISVFASVIGGLVFMLARRSQRLTDRIPARGLGVLFGAMAALAYTLLAGSEVPAQRTLIMLMVAAAGLLLARPAGASIVWLWALAIVLLLDPWAPVAPGFWLSFAAVGLLLFAGTRRMSTTRGGGALKCGGRLLREATRAQWVVTLGLLPLVLAWFQQISLVAPLANAVAIPVVTFGVVSLSLLGIVLPLDFLFVLAHAVFALLMQYLEWLSRFPQAAWQQHSPPGWAIIAGVAGTLLLLAPRGVPLRRLGGIWLLPMFVIAPIAPIPGQFRVSVLDVGQGLSVVVQTHMHTLLFDTGPRYGESSDAGSRVVLPNLRAMGIALIDILVVSHADNDHSGGALSVLAMLPVSRLASSLAQKHPIVEAIGRERSKRCTAGQKWWWDGVQFSVLWPRAGDYAVPRIKTNDLSCVIRIDGDLGSVLLTGDIEARDEEFLLASSAALHADVIVVPHHGSRTSSTRAFVDAVQPSVAVFTTGYRNRFGHPRPAIVARYRIAGASTLRSDIDGEIAIDMDGILPPVPRTARVEYKRYWHDVMSDDDR